MTDTKYLDEAAWLAGWDKYANVPHDDDEQDSIRAHAATLEELDKFRQEVSDAFQEIEDARLGIDPEELARRGVKFVGVGHD